MKVTVPKVYRGLKFPRLIEITFDEFDVERLLPGLFFAIVTQGRARGPRVNDPLLLSEYVEQLSQHERLVGFASAQGRRLLDRWVRTSVVRVGTAHKTRKEEQIESLHPFSLLTYKAGWPEQAQRLRNVDRFLYDRMLDVVSRDEASARRRLRVTFLETFGRGVQVDDTPPYDGRYDGTTTLDSETMLGLCFLDVLKATPARHMPEPRGFLPVLPGVAESMAVDLLVFIATHGIENPERLPITALTRGVMALVNLELFVYTVKLVYSVAELVRTKELPAAMGVSPDPTPPELYVDFTRQKGSASDELARWCAQRDLSAMRRFFEHLVYLRTLDRFAADVAPLAAVVRGVEGPEYLLRLIQNAGLPEVQARAQAEFGAIRDASIEALASEADRSETEAGFHALLSQEDVDPVSMVAQLLAEAQAKTRVESLVKWLKSVGGVNRAFGLIRGTSIARISWRYQMTDDLLTSLVLLSMGRQRGDQRRISIADFLGFLETRFGIIVARPPASQDDSASRAAAQANLAAMKGRLRQMGFFADLSDDFNAQYIRSPLGPQA